MRLLIWLWLAFVTTLSLAPLSVKIQLGTTGRLHTMGHFLIFLITAMVLCWTANSLPDKARRYLAVCAIGIVLEALEKIFYHDMFEWHDVAVDVLGAAVGLALVSIMVPLISGFERDSVSPER